MWFIQGFLSLTGRLMLCAIFVMSVVADKIPAFNECVVKMQKEGIPQPKIMLIGAIAFLIAGSLMIILGYKGRVGALLLLVFLALATYYFHDFWNSEENQAIEILNFMKNLSMAGALVFIMANGTGAWSLDGREKVTDEDFF